MVAFLPMAAACVAIAPSDQHFHACVRCPSYQGVPAISRSLGFGMCTAWKQLQPQYPHDNNGVTRTLPMPVTNVVRVATASQNVLCQRKVRHHACPHVHVQATQHTTHPAQVNWWVNKCQDYCKLYLPCLASKQHALPVGPHTLCHTLSLNPGFWVQTQARRWEQTQATLESCRGPAAKKLSATCHTSTNNATHPAV